MAKVPPRAFMLKQAERLRSIYPRPPDADATVAAWTFCLEGSKVTEDELSIAVSRYIRSPERFFPVPGQLLDSINNDRDRSRSAGFYRASDEQEEYVKLAPGEFRRLLAKYGIKPPTVNEMPEPEEPA